ncbi:MAG: hypothetical protein GY751_15125 [Bacteroidetes bacterium]|nr:hypothetical protein [Bacteroidota bacterium]
MSKRIIFFLLLLIGTLLASAQINPPQNKERALKMIARSDGNQILLRWAPTSPSVWFHCNEVGYSLVRYTYMRDGKLLSFEERSVAKQMTREHIFPWQTQTEWQVLMEEDEYAAIGAQAIFGDSFAVESGTEGNEVSLTNRASERLNRFGFGLFAADHSFSAALAMGLAYVDNTVKPNESYLYRIFPSEQPSFDLNSQQIDSSSLPVKFASIIDTGHVAISLVEHFELPKVIDVKVTFGNRQAMISWDKEIFSFFYVSYVIERSQDGVEWAAVHDMAYVPVDRAEDGSNLAFATDSLEQNNRPYFYRVKGRTVFDEYGPPSDAVQGMGIDPLPFYYPTITSVLPNDQKGLNVSWEFNESDNDKILGFRLMRSAKDSGPFDQISEDDLIPASQRFFIDLSPLPTNYYLVVAIDQYGREMTSFAALAQLNDETPPAVPVGLRGTILKNGTMVVTWENNSEPDLLGYRVYLSNHPDVEFTQLTSKPVPENYFIDTVTLNTLTPEVFIKIFAVDFRQNPSAFSEMLTITRPDTIAPTAPVFRDVVADTEYIYIEWANSSSRDVVNHELYRSPVDEENWTLLKTIDIIDYTSIANYEDSEVEVGKEFQYKVKAVDNAGLSAESKILQARRIDNFIRKTVQDLQTSVDRRSKTVTLSWSYQINETELRTFVIYRAKAGEPLVSVEGISPEEASENVGRGKRRTRRYTFTDTFVRMNTDYEYSVKVVYKNGAQSPLSETITVKY